MRPQGRRKNWTERKMYFSLSHITFIESVFSELRSRCSQESRHVGLHLNRPLGLKFPQIFPNSKVSRNFNIAKIKCRGNPFSFSRVFICGQTDRHNVATRRIFQPIVASTNK